MWISVQKIISLYSPCLLLCDLATDIINSRVKYLEAVSGKERYVCIMLYIRTCIWVRTLRCKMAFTSSSLAFWHEIMSGVTPEFTELTEVPPPSRAPRSWKINKNASLFASVLIWKGFHDIYIYIYPIGRRRFLGYNSNQPLFLAYALSLCNKYYKLLTNTFLEKADATTK